MRDQLFHSRPYRIGLTVDCRSPSFRKLSKGAALFNVTSPKTGIAVLQAADYPGHFFFVVDHVLAARQRHRDGVQGIRDGPPQLVSPPDRVKQQISNITSADAGIAPYGFAHLKGSRYLLYFTFSNCRASAPSGGRFSPG